MNTFIGIRRVMEDGEVVYLKESNSVRGCRDIVWTPRAEEMIIFDARDEAEAMITLEKLEGVAEVKRVKLDPEKMKGKKDEQKRRRRKWMY